MEGTQSPCQSCHSLATWKQHGAQRQGCLGQRASLAREQVLQGEWEGGPRDPRLRCSRSDRARWGKPRLYPEGREGVRGEGPGLRSRQPGLGGGADLVPGLCVCNSPGRVTSYFNAHQFNQPALLLLCRANLRDCPLDVGNGHTVQTGRDLPQRAPQAQTGYVRAAGEGEVPFPSSFNLSDRRHRNAKF